MSIFVRNSNREGMQPKGSSGQWYSVTLANLVCLHVYTENGIDWRTRISGTMTTEGEGFKSREEAEAFVIRVARKRLQAAIAALEESEATSAPT